MIGNFTDHKMYCLLLGTGWTVYRGGKDARVPVGVDLTSRT